MKSISDIFLPFPSNTKMRGCAVRRIIRLMAHVLAWQSRPGLPLTSSFQIDALSAFRFPLSPLLFSLPSQRTQRMNTAAAPPLNLAVVGAGPVGLALALLAADCLPRARIALWDARPLSHDLRADARTLALSLGSVQLLQRLRAWPAAHSQPIQAVHVSQHGAAAGRWGQAEVRLRADEEGVPLLGAVVRHGQLTSQLQQRWLQVSALAPERLHSRFGTPVAGLRNRDDRVEIDAGVVEDADLAVIAEGGVFAQRNASALDMEAPPPLTRDYHQTAWVGQVTLQQPHRGVAHERFTRDGPLALLPLPDDADGRHLAALVWCVPSTDDPVAPLDATQRAHLLNTLCHPEVGPITAVSPLKSFALGLQAHRSLTQGRTVRIGNAAQTLHPVAGQGLNLGLRDAYALVQALRRQPDVPMALRRLAWERGPDRWALLATTDFLARSFGWQWPGADALRGLGLAALQSLGPVKSALARQMMFGRR
jgi:2-octaprenyl-6-methoxyphenol hydroxylase